MQYFAKEKQKRSFDILLNEVIGYNNEIDIIFMLPMNQFTIRDIENLTAIKAHTWRIWEQRYNIGAKQRKGSNHRIYDNDDLKKILRISFLYHAGYKISTIATLSEAEILSFTLSKGNYKNEYEYYIVRLLEAAIDLDEKRFNEKLQKIWKRIGPEDSILKVIYPFQGRVGVLWLTSHLIPAQEHFTSSLILRQLCIAIDSLPAVTTNTKGRILLFTPLNEYHELPLLLLSYLLKKNGYKVIYAGSNVSEDVINIYCKHSPDSPTHVLFYLLTNLNALQPKEYLEAMCKNLPDQKVVMAGPLVKLIKEKPKNAILLQSLQETIDFCEA